MRHTSPPLVIIGASTGGTRVLPYLLERMPPLTAGVLVVQHIPAFITATFAQTLAHHSRMPVKVVEENDCIEPGKVFLSPGDKHCVLSQNHRLQLTDGPKVNYVRPSVDVTALSVREPAPRMAGIILTGMGNDGTQGLCHLKRLGATIIAQEPTSCAVFGMPKHAILSGCVDYVMSPDQIVEWLTKTWGVHMKALAV